MKKQFVFGLAAVFSLVALAAGVESSNTFGVMKVDAGAATEKRDVFISVPWIEVGNSDSTQTVNATNLVLASQLDVGDFLFVYGGGSTAGKFGAWTVVESAGVKYWTSTTIVPPEGAPYEVGSKVSLNRGSGIVVQTAKQYIYLYGQYSPTANTLTIAPGSSSPSYTLIGAQFAKDYDLNNSNQVVWTGLIDQNDSIITSLGEIFKRNANNTKWQKPTGNYIIDGSLPTGKKPVYTEENVQIPQGRGAWYSRNGTNDLTVQFLNY